jgi:hypothetical protein
LHGLGEFGVPPEKSGLQLQAIVMTERRIDDYPIVTCRSVAFRMLAKINRAAAAVLVGTPACQEYLDSVDYWTKGERSGSDALRQEASWLDEEMTDRQ